MMNRLLLPFVLLLSVVIAMETPAVWALTAKQKRFIDSGAYYVNEEGCRPTSSAVTSVNSNVTEEYVFWTLVSKGLTMEQAAGVVGNMWAESGVNPKRVQNTRTPEGDRDTPPPGSIGYGLVQWTPGTKILPDAQTANKSPGDLEFQVNLLWDQLEGRSRIPELSAGNHLKQQTTVAAAAESFMLKFERPRDQSSTKIAERARLAERVFQNFSGKQPPVGITVNPSNSTPNPGCGQGGVAGTEVIIDGFVVYNQFDPAWKDKPYGTSTIGQSGCGPSSIAMVVSTFTGTRVTPEMVANRFDSYYIPDVGSNWQLMIDGPQAYGLRSTDIGTNMDRAATELRSGAMVIATGTGPKPFTSTGHILVIRGITSSGKFLIGDSAHTDTSDQEWEASMLAGYIRNMWVVKKP